MQKTAEEFLEDATSVKGRTVTVCLQSRLQVLEGSWQWELQADAVYCSEVMDFPPGFNGTTGIIHPDDVNHVSAALGLLEDKENLHLEFRIITTYGKVRLLQGQNIALLAATGEEPAQPAWEKVLEESSRHKEAAHLQAVKQLTDVAEKLHGQGTWLLNKSTSEAYYSDNVFRLHGLPPQSLNAHGHTFHPFLHPEDRTTVIDALEAAYAKEVPLHLEYRIVTPKGSTRHLLLEARWLYNNKGQLLCSGILQDISEQVEQEGQYRASESALHLQHQLLELAEKETGAGYWYTNLVTRKITFSDGCLRILGIKQNQLPGSDLFQSLAHPDDRDAVKESMDKLYRDHAPDELEFRIQRPDGKLRYLRQKTRLVVYNTELVMVALLQDITAQKIKEHKLAEANNATSLQRSINDLAEQAAPITSVLWHLPEGTMEWSDGFYRLLGYKPGSIEPAQQVIQKSIHPNDLKSFTEGIMLALNGQKEEDLYFRMATKTGYRQLKMTFRQTTAGAKEVMLGLVQDMTQQVLLKQKVEDETRLNELLCNTVNECVILTNTDHTILTWNQKAEEKTGVEQSKALFQNLFDVLPHLKTADYLVQLQKAAAGEKVTVLLAGKAYMQQPHHYWLSPYADETDTVKGVLHIVQDAAQEQILQQRLSERLNFIESLVESSVDRIVVLDRNMNYLYWNKKAEEYYALGKQRVLGKNILEVFPAFRNDPNYLDFRRVLKGETVYIPAVFHDNSTAYFETYLTPIKDEGGAVTAILWIAHDRSKDRLYQQQQRKAAHILSVIDAAFIELDFDGRFKYINPTAELYFGKPKEELLDKVIWEVYPAAAEAPDYEAITKAVSRREKVEAEFYSGIFGRWTYVNATPTDEGVLLFLYDRQDIREAQQKLKETNQLLLATEAIAHTGSFEIEISSKMVRLSDGLFQILDEEPSPAAPSLDDLKAKMYPGDLAAAIPVVEQSLANKSQFTFLSHIQTGSQVQKTVEVQGKIMCDKEDRPVRILGFVQDITERKKAEADLHKNFVLLQEAEAMAQLGSWEFDIGTGQFNWSEGMYRLFGLPAGTPVSPETYLHFAVPEDKAAARQIVKHLRKTHQPFEEMMRINKEGSPRLLKIKAFVVRNEKGEPQRVVGVDADITEMYEAGEKLRESQHWLQQTTQASPDAILIYDLQKKQPRYLNDRLATWLGTTSAEMVHIGIEGRLKQIHSDDRLRLLHFNELVAASAEGDILTLEYRIRTGEDRTIWLRNRSKVFERNAAGKATHILTILEDVTEEKAAEKALKDLNASLAGKNKELETRNEEITSFAFVASHDLKEPIRKIHTFSHWLMQEEKEQLSEKGQMLLDKIGNAVRRLDLLINDILELTRIHKEKGKKAPVDLNQVLEQAKEELEEELAAKNVEIHAGNLPVITAIQSQLVYLFRNLLSNGVKFQREGNRPHISIRAERLDARELKNHPEASGPYLRLVFEDNGIGFEEQYKNKIFQVFQRLHGKEQFSGTGMGLAICRRIMENHNGFISAESEPAKGSTFCCYFPIAGSRDRAH